MIEWTKPITAKDRKNRVKAIGAITAMGESINWYITKSVGNLSYGLHLIEVKKHPLVSGATITDCKKFAEVYFS